MGFGVEVQGVGVFVGGYRACGVEYRVWGL
jgi:hypothetical protein